MKRTHSPQINQHSSHYNRGRRQNRPSNNVDSSSSGAQLPGDNNATTHSSGSSTQASNGTTISIPIENCSSSTTDHRAHRSHSTAQDTAKSSSSSTKRHLNEHGKKHTHMIILALYNRLGLGQ